GNVELLQKLKAQAFGGDNDKLALALGRPLEEIEAWLGGEAIDEDAQEKIHGIAQVRLGSENKTAE
ncbi:MAG: hypothetical protein H0U87_07040, partial [Acidobacteria bacterium]|nr:hypothetical protein [Acidobacteriota bacterium]